MCSSEYQELKASCLRLPWYMQEATYRDLSYHPLMICSIGILKLTSLFTHVYKLALESLEAYLQNTSSTEE